LPDLDWTIVPIPLSSERLRERGFNQSDFIAEAIADEHIKLNKFLLKRAHREPQAQLDSKKRRRNIKGAFTLRKGVTPPINILLVDDVVTTGSTLREAVRAIRRSKPVNIWAFALTYG